MFTRSGAYDVLSYIRNKITSVEIVLDDGTRVQSIGMSKSDIEDNTQAKFLRFSVFVNFDLTNYVNKAINRYIFKAMIDNSNIEFYTGVGYFYISEGRIYAFEFVFQIYYS